MRRVSKDGLMLRDARYAGSSASGLVLGVKGRADRMRAETIPDIKKSPGGLLRPGSLERLARKSLFGKRLHQFGAIEQLRQLGDRLLGRSMFAGDVTGDDRLRLEDRIDEDVVVHDALVPHGVNAGARATSAPAQATIIRHLLHGVARAQ